MAIVRYQPRDLFDELQREFFGPSRWLKDSDRSMVETGTWVPQVDIKEEPNRFIVMVDVPGVDPKNIEISMENHVLTVKGERQAEHQESDANFTRVERSYGSFYRQFTLPESAASDKITAKTKQGVLEITIPKVEKAKSRTIKIDAHD